MSIRQIDAVTEGEGIARLAALTAMWTDEEFASCIVQLLILDEGLINSWQRTIETMLKVARERELLRSAP